MRAWSPGDYALWTSDALASISQNLRMLHEQQTQDSAEGTRTRTRTARCWQVWSLVYSTYFLFWCGILRLCEENFRGFHFSNDNGCDEDVLVVLDELSVILV